MNNSEHPKQFPSRHQLDVLYCSPATVYLEIAVDRTGGGGLSPTIVSFISVANYRSRVVIYSINHGTHDLSSGLVNLLEQLTEFGEILILYIYYKGYR
jgi:hypothetical protein